MGIPLSSLSNKLGVNVAATDIFLVSNTNSTQDNKITAEEFSKSFTGLYAKGNDGFTVFESNGVYGLTVSGSNGFVGINDRNPFVSLDVVDNYIKAIGGKDMLLNVNTLVSNMDVTIPGAPFKPMAISKQMMPNKISFEMKANMGGQTMSLMKRNFSGEKGYMEQQGQKMLMSEEEIMEAKNVEGIFEELYYSDDQTELLSINSIDGEDVYKIKVVKNEKTSYRYYAVESGYLISIEEEDENTQDDEDLFRDVDMMIEEDADA